MAPNQVLTHMPDGDVVSFTAAATGTVFDAATPSSNRLTGAGVAVTVGV